MKKIITILLVSTLVVCLCACSSPKASPIEDFEYEFEDGTAIITGYTGSDLDIVIPDMIEDRPVTVIGEESFYEYDLNSVVIPEGVTEIQYDAFSGCECLEKITLPTSLRYVSSVSFTDSLWLDNQPDGPVQSNSVIIDYKGDFSSEIYIEDGIVSITDYALRDKSNTVETTRFTSYDDYTGYKAIHIPDSVEYIGEEAVGYISYYSDFHGGTVGKPIINFTIYGKPGSVAETYANENGFIFYSE